MSGSVTLNDTPLYFFTSAISQASSKIRRTSGLRSVPLEIQRAGSVPLHDQNFRYVRFRDCHWTTGSDSCKKSIKISGECCLYDTPLYFFTPANSQASSKIRRTSGLRSVPLEIQRAGSVPLHDQNIRNDRFRDCHWTTGSDSGNVCTG